jgi:hypothetical protein
MRGVPWVLGGLGHRMKSKFSEVHTSLEKRFITEVAAETAEELQGTVPA